MKRILHIVEAFGGGVFTILNDLLNNLAEDYEIIVAYSKRDQTPADFKDMFDKRIKFIEVKNFTREINPRMDIKAMMEIRRLICEIKPCIVHLHSSKAGIIGRLAMSGKKVKMFYNPHGFSFLKQDDSKLKRFIYKLLEWIVANINKKCTIIGCSNSEYEEAKKINKNSLCINNGININKFIQECQILMEKEIQNDKIKICTIGRIGFQKNPEMFNKIAKKFPNIEFTWIGDGDLRDLLTSKNITITGWLNSNEVIRHLNDSDVFILPSLWEGLPVSLLEAMYMKKICLVSNSIGNKDVIKNQQNGFICKNEEQYITIINEIIKGEKYDLNKIKMNAKLDVISEYNTDKMCNRYRNIYD